MKLQMNQEQFFCLRNWALCQDSLNILLTVRYASEIPDVRTEIDLYGSGTAPEGIMLLVHPETGGTGLLCITAVPAPQQVTEFRLHLESTGRALSALHLEYAAADALTAYSYKQIPWQRSPLTQPDITFRVQGERILAELSGDSPAAKPAAAETLSPEAEDLRGAIEADLRILHYYRGSEAARIAAALATLREELADMEPHQAAAALARQEQILSRLIDQTQTELRHYRTELQK